MSGAIYKYKMIKKKYAYNQIFILATIGLNDKAFLLT